MYLNYIISNSVLSKGRDWERVLEYTRISGDRLQVHGQKIIFFGSYI